MKTRTKSAWWLALSITWACGGDDDSGTSTTVATTVSTTLADDSSSGGPTSAESTNGTTNGTTDSTTVSTTNGEDGPADTGPADTGPGESGPADTGPEDTGPEDSGPAETSGGALDNCLMMAADECEECACNNCLAELMACQADPGCVAIRMCAQKNDCTGIECLGPCGDVIDANGGPLGPSVGLASALSDCYTGACPEC